MSRAAIRIKRCNAISDNQIFCVVRRPIRIPSAAAGQGDGVGFGVVCPSGIFRIVADDLDIGFICPIKLLGRFPETLAVHPK